VADADHLCFVFLVAKTSFYYRVCAISVGWLVVVLVERSSVLVVVTTIGPISTVVWIGELFR